MSVKWSRTDLALLGLPEGWEKPVLEHRFHPKRRFRFDYAWPSRMLAIELEGGVWSRGRHVRAAGYLKDMEKYNLATMLGWKILRYPTGRRYPLEEVDWEQVARVLVLHCREKPGDPEPG